MIPARFLQLSRCDGRSIFGKHKPSVNPATCWCFSRHRVGSACSCCLVLWQKERGWHQLVQYGAQTTFTVLVWRWAAALCTTRLCKNLSSFYHNLPCDLQLCFQHSFSALGSRKELAISCGQGCRSASPRQGLPGCPCLGSWWVSCGCLLRWGILKGSWDNRKFQYILSSKTNHLHSKLWWICCPTSLPLHIDLPGLGDKTFQLLPVYVWPELPPLALVESAPEIRLRLNILCVF